MKKTETNLALLTGIFAVCLILSNILASKVLLLFGVFVIPSAVVAYPITFLMTDVIGEIWGKQQANRTVRIGLVCQLLCILLTLIAIFLPVAPFADNQEMFKTILGSSVRVTVASLIAYMASQTWDVFVFHKLKDKSEKHKWLRNNLSTMTSQIIDTAIFITIAFYGTVPNIITMILSQYFIKFIFALLDTPFFYWMTRKNNNEIEEVA